MTSAPPPGWWPASDGNWYPPHLQPGVPPQQYGSSYPIPSLPQKQTNGLAIASLVLSIFWLFGVGSILAVIFGVSARRAIKRSAGTQSGEGLAVAGLVIGIVGITAIVGLGVIGVLVGSSGNQSLGHTVNVIGSDSGGIASVTVYSFSDQVATTMLVPPGPGEQYAIADIGICASGSGTESSPDPTEFGIIYGGGAAVGSLSDAKRPSLDAFPSLNGLQCVRGYVTFDLPTDVSPERIVFSPDGVHAWYWDISGS
jgi:hypothetical protein